MASESLITGRSSAWVTSKLSRRLRIANNERMKAEFEYGPACNTQEDFAPSFRLSLFFSVCHGLRYICSTPEGVSWTSVWRDNVCCDLLSQNARNFRD